MVNRVAEAEANNVLNLYWDGLLPVDVEQIAEQAGIEVQYKSPEFNGEGYQISGQIDTKNDGSRLITLCDTDSKTRKRFTLAHELGHHFMDHGDRHRIDTFVSNIENSEDRKKEWEANEFAASLLMPRKAINLVLDEMEKPTIKKLAEVFDVSEQAMRVRLSRLGMI